MHQHNGIYQLLPIILFQYKLQKGSWLSPMAKSQRTLGNNPPPHLEYSLSPSSSPQHLPLSTTHLFSCSPMPLPLLPLLFSIFKSFISLRFPLYLHASCKLFAELHLHLSNLLWSLHQPLISFQCFSLLPPSPTCSFPTSFLPLRYHLLFHSMSVEGRGQTLPAALND